MMQGPLQSITTLQPPRYPKVLRVGSSVSAAPPRLAEYAYYALGFYSILADGLGISVPMFGSGMQLVLAAFCIIRLGARATAVYAPLRLPIACALSYVVVQITVHGESIMDGGCRTFITWILTLIIVQSLYLRRGFFHRYALVLFTTGLITLPYLVIGGVGIHERGSVGRSMIQGDFTNANGLGDWFGFCCLYFTIVCVETKHNGVRMASILATVGCLYIVGLTVSRGALLAIAIGITIALRRLLRRGFVPLLVFITLSGIIYTFGVFDQMTSRYTTRGLEETGRFLVWPVVIERFLSSPLVGVGDSNSLTYVPGHSKPIAAHNGFLGLALASGILPFALLAAWWVRAAQNAFSYGEQLADSPFRLPLLAYTFVSTMSGSAAFMGAWGLITFAITMASSTPYGVRRFVVHRVERGRMV